MFVSFWDAEGREIQNIAPVIVRTTDVAVLQNPNLENLTLFGISKLEISICKLKENRKGCWDSCFGVAI